MNFKLFALAGFAAASFAGVSNAGEAAKFENGLLVASNGMTLYTFDKDSKNKSNCNDACLKAWPALTATPDTKASGEFGFVLRDDGVKQVAIDGKPLYFYVGDQKAGDVSGDGSGGVWHTVRNGVASKRTTAPANPTPGYSY